MAELIEHTTGHGLTREDVLKHARPALIRALAMQRHTPTRSISRNPIHRDYGPNKSVSVDIQEYAPSRSGFKYAIDFISNDNRLIWSRYTKSKDIPTVIKSIKDYSSHIKTKFDATLKHLWSDNESALVSDECLASMDVAF